MQIPLAEGEAQKVDSTVSDANGVEDWRQFNMLFEPELEAQENTVVVELHNIPAANNIDEMKAAIVELKVRIARVEDIFTVDTCDAEDDLIARGYRSYYGAAHGHYEKSGFPRLQHLNAKFHQQRQPALGKGRRQNST